ncbi:MAG: threonylcarbamoyl-AMP synthase [Clostridia bacterium]|nr:threonylcarbamoyl-AMP synthase [Clostridia bacterium]NCC43459.1 threonylcarbamoyl-AMP synthase [Clostridia bacterium]
MKTKVIRMDREHMDLDIMKMAGDVLKAGGLVAFPTETVYGLGGNALDEQAAEKIYRAKGRPSDNPLIVHIAKIEALDAIVTAVPEKAKMLAKAFWPGPLTMIFPKSDLVPYGTTGGLETVAVRMPNDQVALELILAGGGYVAAPSANTSGRPSPTTAQHVEEDLTGKIDIILDGGPVGIGLESTIVDFTEDVPTILRPGYVNQRMLEKVIGPVRMDKGLIAPDSGIHPKAPGMKYRHYAPKAQLLIVEGEAAAVQSRIRELAEEKILEGNKVGIIATDESLAAYPKGIIKSIGSRNNEESIAQHLFGVLREFDDCGVNYIYSESFDTPQMGQAIMNRLLKAAGQQKIQV